MGGGIGVCRPYLTLMTEDAPGGNRESPCSRWRVGDTELVTVMAIENLVTGFLLISTGVEVFLICIPMWQGSVKPNKFYGVRVPKAFESEENWYKLNRYGARQLMLWSGILVAFGVAAFLLPLQNNFILTMIIGLGPALLVVVPIRSINRYAKTL